MTNWMNLSSNKTYCEIGKFIAVCLFLLATNMGIPCRYRTKRYATHYENWAY